MSAYDATNLVNEIYNSAQNPQGRDRPGSVSTEQFESIIVDNGKLYVPTRQQLSVLVCCNEALRPAAGVLR